jgi:hypothetical protein
MGTLMKRFLGLFAILALCPVLNLAWGEEVSIYGLTYTLVDGHIAPEGADSLERAIDKLNEEMKYATALELADFYLKYAGEDTILRATLCDAKALYLNKQGDDAYKLLDKIKSGFKPEDQQSRDFFSKRVLDIVCSPIYVQRQEEVLKTSTDQDITTPGEWKTVETYDMQWQINLLYLIKDINSADFKTGKDYIISVIDRPGTVSIAYTNQSSPQINVERADDEALAGLIYWGQDIIPGSLVKVLEENYNLNGLGLCLGRPVAFLELASYLKNKIKYTEPKVIQTISYGEGEFTAYRSCAMCWAEVDISLADIFSHFGADPHYLTPFVPKAPKLEKEEIGEESIGNVNVTEPGTEENSGGN